jgi:hypothetical protein
MKEAALLQVVARPDETRPAPKLNVVPIEETLDLFYRLSVIRAE